MRPLTLVPSLALLLILTLVGCERRSVVKIGMVGGMTGTTADVGVEGRRGVLLAVSERNEDGGINGRRIELISANDAQDADVVRAAIVRFKEEKCVGVVGPFTSEMSLAILPMLQKTEMLVISPTTATPEVGGIDDQFLRTYSSSTAQAVQMADYMYDERAIRRLAIFYDTRNRAFVETYAEALQKRFRERGAEEIPTLPFGAEQASHFRAFVERALEHAPDGVFVLANAHDTALICQQLKKSGTDLDVFASEWSSSPELIAYGGKAVEGITMLNVFDPEHTSPRFLRFVSRFKKHFGTDPSFAAVFAFDSAQILFDGLEAAGPAKAKHWILEKSTFQTLQGEVTLDPFGDAVRTSYIVQLQNGQFKRIGMQK